MFKNNIKDIVWDLDGQNYNLKEEIKQIWQIKDESLKIEYDNFNII